MSNPAKSIRIGTMIKATEGQAPENIRAIADLGFESFEPFFWQTTNGQDLAELGKRSLDAIGNRDITISTLGMFGNPLEDKEMDRQTLQGWKDCIDNAHHFCATCVAGFTGRIRDKPLTDSLPRYKQVWSDLARRAERADLDPRHRARAPGPDTRCVAGLPISAHGTDGRPSRLTRRCGGPEGTDTGRRDRPCPAAASEPGIRACSAGAASGHGPGPWPAAHTPRMRTGVASFVGGRRPGGDGAARG